MKVLVAVIAASAVAAATVVAASGEAENAPTAIASVLPKHYRLLVTSAYDHGKLREADYGRRGADPGDAPLIVWSHRGRGKLDYGNRPEHHSGDEDTTVRGHPAYLRTLTDEGRRYARELIWRERDDLVVRVQTHLHVHVDVLRRVAEHVRLLGRRAWARLYMQTSYRAQEGHVTRDMTRRRVARGRLNGHRWRLYALIPPHYPLSSDDLRASCTEVRYGGKRGHGDYCASAPNWQRVGGAIFVFGEVGRRARGVRVRPTEGHAFDLHVRTRRAKRGPRVRYFATPLPNDACAVRITPAGHPHAEGTVALPMHGADARRCRRG